MIDGIVAGAVALGILLALSVAARVVVGLFRRPSTVEPADPRDWAEW